MENAFDPDFIIDEASYHIEKVLSITGFGCRYLLSTEVVDDAAGAGYRGNLLGASQNPEDKKLYMAKGYIFADERQCRVY